MKNLYFSWIGPADMGLHLRGEESGPLITLLEQVSCDELILVSPHEREQGASFKSALESRFSIKITAINIPDKNPNDLPSLYQPVMAVFRYALENFPPESWQWNFFMGPGGWAPSAIWMLAPLQSDRTAPAFWFLDAAGSAHRCDWLIEPDERILNLSGASERESASTDEFRSSKATRLLEKEGMVSFLTSPGSDPENMLRLFFPRKKIIKLSRKTLEEGTENFQDLFSGGILNHIPSPEELSRHTQLTLASYLEDTDTHTPASPKVIFTSRIDLNTAVRSGILTTSLTEIISRTALFLPPLPEEHQILIKLIHIYLDQLNSQYALRTEFRSRKLSAEVIHYLTTPPYPFPDAVSLKRAIEQAVIISDDEILSIQTLKNIAWESSPTTRTSTRTGISPATIANPLEQPLEEGVDLRETLSDVARYYLSKAMKITGGNKTRSAEILGLQHYQTLTNWLKKYGLEEE